MRIHTFPRFAQFLRVLLICAIAGAFALFFQITPTKAYSNNGVPVIMVHGFSQSAGTSCNDSSTFGSIKQFLAANGWTGPLYTVKYYNGDTNCDADLHALENGHCTGWYAGNNGTTNEDLRHITCLLAWYIWDHFTVNGVAVKVIAHSMGGTIIRQTLFDTPYVGAFPPYITVEDAVTAGSPHQGLTSGAAFFFCGSCSQVAQIEAANALTKNLNSTSFRSGFGRNPQGNTGTDWTNMSSYNDEALAWCASVGDTFGGYLHSNSNTMECGFMPGATHLVAYWGPSPSYNHGGYLTDQSTSWNADVAYSDTNGSVWYSTTGFPHSILTMRYAIAYTSW